MTSYVWPSDNHNISDGWDEHIKRGSLGGRDLALAYGTPFYSMADGTVTIKDMSTTGSGGRYLSIRSADGNSVQYLHLKDAVVSLGQTVKQGQLLGHSGASAYGSEFGTDGPHLHVHGVHSNGVRFDIFLYITGSGSGGNATPVAPTAGPTPSLSTIAALLEVIPMLAATYVSDPRPDGHSDVSRVIIHNSGIRIYNGGDVVWPTIVANNINAALGLKIDSIVFHGNDLHATRQLLADFAVEFARVSAGGGADFGGE